jgi:hypothetical protein
MLLSFIYFCVSVFNLFKQATSVTYFLYKKSDTSFLLVLIFIISANKSNDLLILRCSTSYDGQVLEMPQVVKTRNGFILQVL